MTDLQFSLTCNKIPHEGDCVYVCGSILELGSWQPEKAISLTPNHDRHKWTAKTTVSHCESVEYRYFCGRNVGASIVVTEWETHLKPRVIGSSFSADDEYGILGGLECTDQGWLTCQTEVRFHFHGDCIRTWKSSIIGEKYKINCTAVNLEELFSGNDSSAKNPGNSLLYPTQFAILREYAGNFEDIPEDGATYSQGDFLVFRSQSVNPEITGYRIEVLRGVQNAFTLLGMSLVLPAAMSHNSQGSLTLPLSNADGKPVAQVTMDYVLVHPMPTESLLCSMEVSYTHHWNPNLPPLDMGHRGMGNSYKKDAICRENTIASMNMAAEHGADFVEFDVVLSKDEIPVVYHDLNICVNAMKKDAGGDWIQVPVHKLLYADLCTLRVGHTSWKQKDVRNPVVNESSLPDAQPFPTLKNFCDKVDPCLGFNMEIKACLRNEDGNLEENILHFWDKNSYVDIILRTLLTTAGKRRVILSCFEPDVATMLRLKQNKYPVCFLTQGETTRYDSYYDPRTLHIPIACSYAKSEKLLGINPQAEELLRHPDRLERTLNEGLRVFTWGEDCNSNDNIRWLKDHGAHAVIYDRMNEFSQKTQNIFKD